MIGSREQYGHYLEEIAQASHGKLQVAKWIESKGDLDLSKARKNHSDIILIADKKVYETIRNEVSSYQKDGYDKKFLSDLAEQWLNRIPLDLIEEYQEYYEMIFTEASIPQVNRVFDVAMGIIMAVLALPFIILFGFLIMITSGFPIIFKQKRTGLEEKPFMFYKLRSLKTVKNIDTVDNPNATIEKRITLVGRIIRKTRIDEFPQFMNILNGSMSVVGPRPEMVSYHEKWVDRIPFYKYRNMVKPGLTGWAQIHYNHTTTLEEYRRKTEYDLYYVKNKSILLDIRIMLMTFETMLGMRGSR